MTQAKPLIKVDDGDELATKLLRLGNDLEEEEVFVIDQFEFRVMDTSFGVPHSIQTPQKHSRGPSFR